MPWYIFQRTHHALSLYYFANRSDVTNVLPFLYYFDSYPNRTCLRGFDLRALSFLLSAGLFWLMLLLFQRCHDGSIVFHVHFVVPFVHRNHPDINKINQRCSSNVPTRSIFIKTRWSWHRCRSANVRDTGYGRLAMRYSTRVTHPRRGNLFAKNAFGKKRKWGGNDSLNGLT